MYECNLSTASITEWDVSLAECQNVRRQTHKYGKHFLYFPRMNKSSFNNHVETHITSMWVPLDMHGEHLAFVLDCDNLQLTCWKHPLAHELRIIPAIWRPLPTPAPSPRKKPARDPSGRKNWWRCAEYWIPSSCSLESFPESIMSFGILDEWIWCMSWECHWCLPFALDREWVSE